MDEPLTFALFTAVGVVTAALGYTIGRSVGQKEGHEKGMSEVSFLVGPYVSVEEERAEIGYSLQIVLRGEPVLRPIDTIIVDEQGKKLDQDKEQVKRWTSNALGYATTMIGELKAAGLAAAPAEEKKRRR